MKASERHRLKDNDLATLAQNVQHTIETRKREVGGILIGVVVIVAIIIGYSAWQSRLESRASAALASAMATLDTPAGPQPDEQNPQPGPRFATERERDEEALAKFKAAADEFGSTDAGQLARYREGSLLLSLARPAEAVTAFQQVADANDEILGQMARLGLAEAHAQAGDYDQAIAVYQELSASATGPVPVEGVLMQLARAYRSAGRTEEARQTFTRVVDEFTASPYRPEAQRELQMLEQS